MKTYFTDSPLEKQMMRIPRQPKRNYSNFVKKSFRKGITINSGVGGFSGMISSKNFSTRNDLLSYVKDEIDYEYDDCIASGWKKVEMYVKIESRTDGSYFLYVMYG